MQRWINRLKRQVNRITKKKTLDRRGKHTKASRAAVRATREAYYRSVTVVKCVQCSGSNFAQTDDHASMVCVGCGLVDENQRITVTGLGQREFDCFVLDDKRSGPYHNRNYYAERIRQFNNTEPRFSTLEKSQIYGVQSFLERHVGPEWSAGLLSKDKFGQICRLLDQLRPGQRWRQKLERWHQAKIMLSGRCDYVPDLPGTEVTHKMKVIFDGFAFVFEKFFRGAAERRNVPKLDLVCLILLYNIKKSVLWRFGWFFMNPQIWWESQSVLRDYDRCVAIADKCNSDLVKLEPSRKLVRRDTMVWFRNHQLIVPSLSELRSCVPYNYDQNTTVPYKLTLVHCPVID